MAKVKIKTKKQNKDEHKIKIQISNDWNERERETRRQSVRELKIQWNATENEKHESTSGFSGAHQTLLVFGQHNKNSKQCA